MRKVLLLNQGQTNNYGDIAINRTIETFLSKNYCVDFLPYWDEKLIFGNWYKGNKIFYKIAMRVPVIRDYFYNKFLRNNICDEYEKIIIGGGELLSDHKGFNTAFYNLIKYFRNKSKIYVIGVNTNSNLNKELMKRYAESYSYVDKFMVRDGFTKELLQREYGISVSLYPDVAFAYRKIIGDDFQVGDRSGVVLSPIEYRKEFGEYLGVDNREEYITVLIEAIKTNRIENETIIIAPTVDDDEDISKDIYNKLVNSGGKNVRLMKYSSLDDYISLLQNSRSVVSCRMHGLILAKCYGCNIDTVVFKNKLKVFKKEYQDSHKSIDLIMKDSLRSLNELL